MIEANGLRKTYAIRGAAAVHALDDLSLSVPAGTVQALLGPNGAGKTTAVKVLTTLLKPDAGSAVINGVDVLRDPKAVRRMIGVSGQYAAVDQNLTGMENLEMVGRLYHLRAAAAKARARELIELFDLSEAQHRVVSGFSGGMRRRLDLAGALVINPQVLFLDEPTTGLDPRGRLGMWEIIRNLVAAGTTVLLTTQYLEEADQLADQIAVVDRGRVIIAGTPDELKATVGGQRIALTLVSEADAGAARAILARHGIQEPVADGEERSLEMAVEHAARALQAVLAELDAAGIALHDAGIRRPTLDDVFLTLTGRAPAADGGEAR